MAAGTHAEVPQKYPLWVEYPAPGILVKLESYLFCLIFLMVSFAQIISQIINTIMDHISKRFVKTVRWTHT